MSKQINISGAIDNLKRYAATLREHGNEEIVTHPRSLAHQIETMTEDVEAAAKQAKEDARLDGWYNGYTAACYDEQRWFRLGKERGKLRGEAIGFIFGLAFGAAVVYFTMRGLT